MTPYLLHHLLERRRGSTETALRQHERTLTYGQFAEASERCAAVLLSAGLSRGERVAIYLPKGIDECWAIFGTSMAGGVFVPVNPQLKGAQVRHIVDDCRPRVLVTTREMHQAVADALRGAEPAPVVLFVSNGALERADSGPGDAVVLHSDRRAEPPCVGEDLAAILYTSGSTGRPKGVMLSHRNLLAGARIVSGYLDIRPDDRLLSVLPFSFDYGLNQLLTAVERGAELVPFTFRFGDELVRALDRYAITGLAGVPTIWAILTGGAPSLERTPLPGLRYITNTGGAVPTATVRRLRALLPQTRIFLMYGLTEAFRSTFLPPEEVDRRPNSIGKAIPECEVFLLTEDGRRARAGETGVLVHRGPTVSMGYWNRPEDTARVLRPNPLKQPHEGADLVCFSGDLMTQDDEGFLYFVGRNDAMIKSSGYRISPTEVEEALMATGAFRQVAVIGLPDPAAGQRVHAVAVPAEGGTSVREAQIQCARVLPAYMTPREIELVAQLPKTPNGKVDVKALVRERTERSAGAAA